MAIDLLDLEARLETSGLEETATGFQRVGEEADKAAVSLGGAEQEAGKVTPTIGHVNSSLVLLATRLTGIDSRLGIIIRGFTRLGAVGLTVGIAIGVATVAFRIFQAQQAAADRQAQEFVRHLEAMGPSHAIEAAEAKVKLLRSALDKLNDTGFWQTLKNHWFNFLSWIGLGKSAQERQVEATHHVQEAEAALHEARKRAFDELNAKRARETEAFYKLFQLQKDAGVAFSAAQRNILQNNLDAYKQQIEQLAGGSPEERIRLLEAWGKALGLDPNEMEVFIRERIKLLTGLLLTETDKMRADLGKTLESQVEQGLGDIVANTFEAAFSHGGNAAKNAVRAMEGTILASLGSLMVEEGKVLISYGVVLTGLRSALFNIFTAGPAAIAAGVALVALGSAFSAVAKSFAVGRGTASAGAYREPQFGSPQNPADQLVRTTLSTGNEIHQLAQARDPLDRITVIGARDPVTQEIIAVGLREGQRRGLS